MAQWKLRTSFISQIHMFVFSLIFLSCSQDVSERYKICKGFWDYDTTYFIVDTIKDSIIYFSGHNPIRNDTIIKGNHIFIEDVITEECSDRMFVDVLFSPYLSVVVPLSSLSEEPQLDLLIWQSDHLFLFFLLHLLVFNRLNILIIFTLFHVTLE